MQLEPTLKPPFCSEHRIPMVWGETEFAFAKDGIEVVVRHIPAWVCPYHDDAAFPPGVTDELIMTIRELIDAVKQTHITHNVLPQAEFLVRVNA